MPTTIMIPTTGDTVAIHCEGDRYHGKVGVVVGDQHIIQGQRFYAVRIEEDQVESYPYRTHELELPIGICPVCGEPVFHLLDIDGPVWICPRDLSPHNPYWEPSEVTEKQQEEDQVFSLCYEDHGGWCGDHMPMHSTCYDMGDY